MVASTREVLDAWKLGETRNLTEDLTRLTLRVATKTLFGEDVGDRGLRVSIALAPRRALLVEVHRKGTPWREGAGRVGGSIRNLAQLL